MSTAEGSTPTAAVSQLPAHTKQPRPCIHWKQGHCPHGIKCKYGHEPQDKGIFAKPERKAGEEADASGSRSPVPTLNSLPGMAATASSSSSTHPARPAAAKGPPSSPNAGRIYNFSNFPVKTVVCRHWLSGNCGYGDNCRFRHDNAVPQPIAQLQGAPDGPSEGSSTGRNRRRQSQQQRQNDGKEEERLAEEKWKKEIARLAAVQAVKDQEDQIRREKLQREREERERAAQLREQAARQREEQKREEEAREQGAAQLVLEQAARQQEEQRRQEQARREEQKRAKKERSERQKRAREEQKRREDAQRAEMARREAERLERERLVREAREEAQRRHKLQLEVRWREEATVIDQFVVLDSSLVTCGAGLDIHHIITGFELCRITIKNLPRNATANEVAGLFMDQGVSTNNFFVLQVRDVGRGIGIKREAVVLADSEQGEAIALGLEGIEFRHESLSFETSDNASWNAMGNTSRGNPFLTVNWKVPTGTIVATYTSTEEACEHIKTINALKTWKGSQIQASLDAQPRQRFAQLDVSTAVKIAITPASPEYVYCTDFSDFVGTHNLRALKSWPYNHQNTHDTLRRHLAAQPGVKMDTYEVLTPEEGAVEQKLRVQFDDWENVKQAHGTIDKKKALGFMSTPYLRAWHPKPLQYQIKIPNRQYLAQKRQWDALSEKKPGIDAHIHTRIGDLGDVFIRVLGEDKKAAGSLKVRVESMVAGEALDAAHWHPSFVWAEGRGGTRPFFDRVHAQTGVHVRSDFKTRSLKVYGEPDMLDAARRMVKEEVDRLADTETTRVLNDRGAIGFFIREGLSKLKELIGEDNVNLNLSTMPRRITVKGGEDARHHLQRLIDESRASAALGAILPNISEGETCPICYDDVSNPEQLGCGHTYCSGCLKHFMTSATDTKTFPLVCMGNDATCNTPISIPFIRRFLHPQAFQHLVEVAFNCYLEQHPQELKYCTTPDCKQIYRRQTDKVKLQCPSCFSAICPGCDEEAHEGMTCAERRIHSNPAEQERLNDELAAANGYKKCPQCNIWIEKTEGCNHMSCKCGAHICWRCMGTFDAGDIYAHMNSAHGNIYDEAPAGVNVGHVPHQAFLEEQADALAQIERDRFARAAQAHPYYNAFQPRNLVPAVAHAPLGAVRRLDEVLAARRAQEIAQAAEQARVLEANALREETARLEREAARRRLEEEIRRQNVQLNGYQRRFEENRRRNEAETAAAAARQRAEEERGGWCVVM